MMSERMNKRPLLQRDPVELANQVKAIDRNLFRYGHFYSRNSERRAHRTMIFKHSLVAYPHSLKVQYPILLQDWNFIPSDE